MNEEMKNTKTPVEEKKDNKKKAIIAVLALLVAGCAVGLPLYMMNGSKEDAEQLASVTLEEQEVPLAASVEDAEEPEVEEEAAVTEEAQEDTEEADDEDTNNGNTSATGNEVPGGRRMITDADELAAQAEVLGAFLETLPATAAPAALTTVVDTTDVDAEAAAQREAAIWQQNLDAAREEAARQQAAREEAERLAAEAAEKAARVEALDKRIKALQKALDDLDGDSRQAAALVAELEEETSEFKDALIDANEALNEAKAAAVTVAKTAGASMEAILEIVNDYSYYETDKRYDSPLFYFFHRDMGYDQPGKEPVLDSTGGQWALGGNKDAKEGTNAEIIAKVKADENADAEVVAELEGKLPTENTLTEEKKNPDIAYKVMQNIIDYYAKDIQYSIIWAPEFSAVGVGEDVAVYYLDDYGTLYVGTAQKIDGGNLKIKGLSTEDINTNMQPVTIPEGETALTYLQDLTVDNYSAQAIVDGTASKNVNDAAENVAQVVNSELLTTVEALAAEQNITVEEVATEYGVELPVAQVLSEAPVQTPEEPKVEEPQEPKVEEPQEPEPTE